MTTSGRSLRHAPAHSDPGIGDLTAWHRRPSTGASASPADQRGTGAALGAAAAAFGKRAIEKTILRLVGSCAFSHRLGHLRPYAASSATRCSAPRAAICRELCARDIGCFGQIAATPAAENEEEGRG